MNDNDLEKAEKLAKALEAVKELLPYAYVLLNGKEIYKTIDDALNEYRGSEKNSAAANGSSPSPSIEGVVSTGNEDRPAQPPDTLPEVIFAFDGTAGKPEPGIAPNFVRADIVRALLDKMAAADKPMNDVFMCAKVHGVSYTGPQWGPEYKKLRELIG